MNLRKIQYIFILFIALFFFGGIPVEFGDEGTFFHGFMIPKPVISIGLGTNLDDIKIRSSSGMKIYEVSAGYELISSDTEEVLIKGGGDILTEKFVLLVAHTQDREEADLLAEELKKNVAGRVTIEEDEENTAGGIFEVRLGDFLTRGDALQMIQTLNDLGMEDIWIEREILPVQESQPLWMLLENRLQPLNGGSVLYFIPGSPQSYLSYNGRSYRGLLILRGTRRGIVLVNVLNMEDYLLSVVPGELSPGLFGSIEALKAQAVAARTYAAKNMGRFKSLGYDLVNTPRSQIYRGMISEHPLSTQAVEQTRGEVLLYKGELINALYTSTCGGKTEDVENIFSGRPSPYLKSVECTYEKQPEWHLDSPLAPAAIMVGGRNVGFDIASLISLGVIPQEESVADFKAGIPFDMAEDWIRRSLRLLGIPDEDFAPAPIPLNFVNLAGVLISAFRWQDRVDHLLLPSEVDFLLENISEVEGKERGPLAYCFQSGIYPVSLRTGDPYRKVTRADLAFSLAKIIQDHKDIYRTGIFRSAAEGTVEVGLDIERQVLELSPHLYLLRSLDGTSSFANHLTLLGGEKLRWIEHDGRVGFLEIFFPPNSNVLDRTSRYNLWRVQKTRDELESRISHSSSIGELVDLSVRSRGSSGRVTELSIVGTEKETVVHGFQIRSVLGLRDTLFVIDREYDETNGVASFTFSGRGWGHGVGLCQVGAYGMAVAGAEYTEILKKYYQNTKIDKLY